MSVFRPINSDESNLFTIRATMLGAVPGTDAGTAIFGADNDTIAFASNVTKVNKDFLHAPTSNNLPAGFKVVLTDADRGIMTVTFGKEFTSQPTVLVQVHNQLASTAATDANMVSCAVKHTSSTTATLHFFTSATGTVLDLSTATSNELVGFDLMVVGPVKIGLTTGNSNKGWQVEGGSSPADVYTYMNVGIGQGNPSGSFEVVDENTTTNATSITADSLTTADALVISADALTTGTAVDVTSSSSSKAAGALVNIAQSNVTETQAAATLEVSTTATTNTDAGAALFTADALTAGNAVGVSADGLISGTGLDIEVAGSALTSGKALNVSVAPSSNAGNITGVAAAFATTATSGSGAGVASFTGDSLTVGNAVSVSANALTDGNALSVSSSSNAKVEALVSIAQTGATTTQTGGTLEVSTTATTQGAVAKFTGNAITSGKGVEVLSSATAITGAGRLFKSTHSGTTSSSGVLNEFATAATDETVLARFSASAALAAGKVVDLEADNMTTGTALTIDGLDTLTTGSALVINSDSSNASTRNIVSITQDNSSATGATALSITQDAAQDALAITGGSIDLALTGGANNAALPSNITLTSNSAGDDLTIALAGASDSSLILSSSGTGDDALQITTTAGGIDITNGGAAGQTEPEDIDITSSNASINITANENTATAINISSNNAAGGMTFDSGTGNINFCVSADARTTNLLTGNAIQTVNLANNDTPANVINIGGAASKLGFFGLGTAIVRPAGADQAAVTSQSLADNAAENYTQADITKIQTELNDVTALANALRSALVSLNLIRGEANP